MNRLKDLREDRDLKQTEIAKILGITSIKKPYKNKKQ